MSDQQGVAQRDMRSPWQRRNDALWTGLKWRVYLLYCHTLYRPHMQIIHRRGWHWRKHLRLDDGSEQLWCQWCGDRWTRRPNRWAEAAANAEQLLAANGEGRQ